MFGKCLYFEKYNNLLDEYVITSVSVRLDLMSYEQVWDYSNFGVEVFNIFYWCHWV